MPPEPLYKFKPGDRVRILNSGYRRCKILEIRGPLGPGGSMIYSVMYRRRPKGLIEVREDQLELLPPNSSAE